MKSKTSCFNKTVYKKNLTRFAPAWGAYLLCLLLGLAMMYMQGVEDGKRFWFAEYMAQCISAVMTVVNLVYGALVAQLLFGDLYNSRMCNAMHAMPLRREGWFLTNVLSGITFSVVPTAIMAALSIPLLMGTCVHNAWQIGLLWFAGANLEFLCFFGIAVFCTFCAGNRIAMAAIYAVLNFAAPAIYWVVDSLYRPMLYGVVTPSDWVKRLCPFANMADETYVELDNYYDLAKRFEGHLENMVANFSVSEKFYDLIVWGGVGIVLMVIALLLYRKRDVECAGDAAAFSCLKPVLLVLCALGGGAAGLLGLEMFFGYWEKGSALAYGFLGLGMTVGWFAGKMFLERSTRVFAPKNWLGLLGVGAVVALSLVLTWFDVLGFVEWTPEASEVKSVFFGEYAYSGTTLTEQEDIEAILRLQQLALEDRVEDAGGFPVEAIRQDENGYYYIDQEVIDALYEAAAAEDGTVDSTIPDWTMIPYRYCDSVYMAFELENGRTVTRRYYIWCDGEEAGVVKEYLSRWDVLGEMGHYVPEHELDLDDLESIRFEGSRIPVELITRENAEELLAAIQADCRERNMVQNSSYHNGYFSGWDEENEETVSTRSLYLQISDTKGGVGVEVFADSAHTLKWLTEHGLLHWEVQEGNVYNG